MGCVRSVRACFGLTQRAWAFLNSVLATTDVQIWSSRSLPEHFVRVGDSSGKGQGARAGRAGRRHRGGQRTCAHQGGVEDASPGCGCALLGWVLRGVCALRCVGSVG